MYCNDFESLTVVCKFSWQLHQLKKNDILAYSKHKYLFKILIVKQEMNTWSTLPQGLLSTEGILKHDKLILVCMPLAVVPLLGKQRVSSMIKTIPCSLNSIATHHSLLIIPIVYLVIQLMNTATKMITVNEPGFNHRGSHFKQKPWLICVVRPCKCYILQ